jgi:hypothetical protein
MPAERRASKELTERDQQLLREIADQDANARYHQTRTIRAARRADFKSTLAISAGIVLAAAAGLVASLQGTHAARVATALLAFGSAIVGGLTKTFDLPKLARVRYYVFNMYSRLRDDFSGLARDVGWIDYDAANDRFHKLLDRRGQIEESERTNTEPTTGSVQPAMTQPTDGA